MAHSTNDCEKGEPVFVSLSRAVFAFTPLTRVLAPDLHAVLAVRHGGALVGVIIVGRSLDRSRGDT